MFYLPPSDILIYDTETKKVKSKPHFFTFLQKNLKILAFIPEIEPKIYDYTYPHLSGKTQNGHVHQNI
ncbi:hypothetical protein C6500_02415 [Candidatus Poribacteria bacterium]|nr:MAG: hypothetical protein C6500_02415 [Candidatus Poribacteria bacterium]